jgi:hypothetical protein
MAEEVKNASLIVPRMMISTVILNGALGFVMIITYCFSVQDVEQQIIGSAAPYPFVEIFAVATGSTAGAIGMTMPILLVALSVHQRHSSRVSTGMGLRARRRPSVPQMVHEAYHHQLHAAAS